MVFKQRKSSIVVGLNQSGTPIGSEYALEPQITATRQLYATACT